MTMSNEQALSTGGEFNPKVAMEWLTEAQRLREAGHKCYLAMVVLRCCADLGEPPNKEECVQMGEAMKAWEAALASSNAAHAATDKPKAEGASGMTLKQWFQPFCEALIRQSYINNQRPIIGDAVEQEAEMLAEMLVIHVNNYLAGNALEKAPDKEGKE